MSNEPPPYQASNYQGGYQYPPQPSAPYVNNQPYPTTYDPSKQPLLPPSGYGPPQQQITTTTIIQPSVVVVGGCPACRVGVLEDDFTCFGVCCAIFFFPLGILCCLATKQRRCPNCGAIFA